MEYSYLQIALIGLGVILGIPFFLFLVRLVGEHWTKGRLDAVKTFNQDKEDSDNG